jgi:hypothetical protein
MKKLFSILAFAVMAMGVSAQSYFLEKTMAVNDSIFYVALSTGNPPEYNHAGTTMSIRIGANEVTGDSTTCKIGFGGAFFVGDYLQATNTAGDEIFPAVSDFTLDTITDELYYVITCQSFNSGYPAFRVVEGSCDGTFDVRILLNKE